MSFIKIKEVFFNNQTSKYQLIDARKNNFVHFVNLNLCQEIMVHDAEIIVAFEPSSQTSAILLEPQTEQVKIYTFITNTGRVTGIIENPEKLDQFLNL